MFVALKENKEKITLDLEYLVKFYWNFYYSYSSRKIVNNQFVLDRFLGIYYRDFEHRGEIDQTRYIGLYIYIAYIQTYKMQNTKVAQDINVLEYQYLKKLTYRITL